MHSLRLNIFPERKLETIKESIGKEKIRVT